MVDLFLGLLYPPRCPSCGREIRAAGRPLLCRGCRGHLAPIPAACRRCGEPGGDRICRRCTLEPPPFASARACFLYRDDDLSSHLMALWKYHGDHVVGASLASILCEHRGRHAECYDLVVPVPLHASRLAQRGFNQAAVLAGAIARRHERVAVDALRREGRTTTQTALGRRARAHNVRAVFAVRSARQLAGRSVLLVDDVVTTGATVRACSEVLLSAGARCIAVWSLARTPQTTSPAHTAPHARRRGAPREHR